MDIRASKCAYWFGREPAGDAEEEGPEVEDVEDEPKGKGRGRGEGRSKPYEERPCGPPTEDERFPPHVNRQYEAARAARRASGQGRLNAEAGVDRASPTVARRIGATPAARGLLAAGQGLGAQAGALEPCPRPAAEHGLWIGWGPPQ